MTRRKGSKDYAEWMKRITINHKTVLCLMNKFGIRPAAWKRRCFRSPSKKRSHYRYPHLLQ